MQNNLIFQIIICVQLKNLQKKKKKKIHGIGHENTGAQ